MPSEPRRRVYRSHDELLATLLRARDADPREAPFGVLIQDPWEDGDQQFFWYDDRYQLEFALLDAHAFVDPEAWAEDQDEWTDAQFDLDHALREIAELRPHEASTLDELVNDFFCIVWIGHFEDLAQGEDPIAVQLRDELRRGTPAAEEDGALTAEELEPFVALLRAFGTDDDEDPEA